MSTAKQTVQLFLVAPDGEHPVGTFIVDEGQVTGIDRRGITYSGTLVRHGENAQLELSAHIPKGTRITSQLHTEAAADVPLKLHLNANQQVGQETIPIRLPGFGAGDVKLVVT
jgi:hypothetical protein